MRPTQHAAQILLQLQDCLCEEIASWVEQEKVADVCICSVMPGNNVVLDHCSECGKKCGMAWVQMDSITPDQNQEAVPGCAVPLLASFTVGMARCAPYMEGRALPEATQYLEAQVRQLTDMDLMYRAITCCPVKARIGMYTPLGPEGGCVGGTWNLTVDLDA